MKRGLGKRRTIAARDAHTLAGAYAMDAISGRDRVRFERHLAGCQECTQEIASLREAPPGSVLPRRSPLLRG
jgi:hypothetical protein